MGLCSLVLSTRNIIRSSRAGQSLVEYALVLTFISVLSILVMSFLSGELSSVYATILSALDSVRSAI
jgi:Flp pilus assembly pilin Flp